MLSRFNYPLDYTVQAYLSFSFHNLFSCQIWEFYKIEIMRIWKDFQNLETILNYYGEYLFRNDTQLLIWLDLLKTFQWYSSTVSQNNL